MAKTKHFLILDGLRGVAALAVLCMHSSYKIGFNEFPARGYLAVDFFFMLSGFVVASAYEDRLKSGQMGFRAFVKIRTIRLYPLIALGVFMGAVGTFLHIYLADKAGAPLGAPMTYQALAISIVLGFLLLPFGPLGKGLMPLDNPLWSIFFEVGVNLVYAAAIRILAGVVALRVAVIVSVIVLTAQALHFHSINFGHEDATMSLGVARVCASFFIGIGLFRLYERGAFARVPKVPGLVLTVALIASFIWKPIQDGGIFDMTCVVLLFPAVIIFAISDNVSARWRPAVRISGRLSYPIYTLHEPIVDHLAHMTRFDGPERIAMLVATMALVVFISYWVTVLYDEPIRERVKGVRRATAETAQ